MGIGSVGETVDTQAWQEVLERLNQHLPGIRSTDRLSPSPTPASHGADEPVSKGSLSPLLLLHCGAIQDWGQETQDHSEGVRDDEGSKGAQGEAPVPLESVWQELLR